jgi:hypothetical protein
VAAAVAVGALASFAGMLALRSSAPSRAYYGTDTRAYQLLVGAGLALLPGIVAQARGRRAAWLLAPVGLFVALVTASSLFDQGPFLRGAAATAAAAALIVGVEAHPSAPVARGLSVRPIAYLGTISYGTYLWHWPVIVIAQELGIFTSATTLALLTALLATGIAALSNELLELPIRRAGPLDRHRRSVIIGGVAVSVLAAVVVVPPLLDLDRPRIDPSPAALGPDAEGTPVPGTFDFAASYDDRFGEGVDCTGAPVTDCTIVEGDGPHVLLIGDSNAVMYVPALTELARAEGLRLSLAATDGCPWQLGFVHLTDEIQERCRRVRPDTYERLLPELDPDVVLLVNTRLYASNALDPTAPPGPELAAATETSLDLLEATDATIVLVQPSPTAPSNASPLECLSEASTVEQCSFDHLPRHNWFDELLEERAAASEQVHLVDWGQLVCPRLPRCDAMIGGHPVFWNAEHITRAHSESLAIPIGRELAALGIIPPLTSTGG